MGSQQPSLMTATWPSAIGSCSSQHPPPQPRTSAALPTTTRSQTTSPLPSGELPAPPSLVPASSPPEPASDQLTASYSAPPPSPPPTPPRPTPSSGISPPMRAPTPALSPAATTVVPLMETRLRHTALDSEDLQPPLLPQPETSSLPALPALRESLPSPVPRLSPPALSPSELPPSLSEGALRYSPP